MTVTTAPRLREELELITGMDDLPLIYDPATGVYHRVSRSGQAILQKLDGQHTPEDLVELVRGKDPAQREAFRQQLDRFLEHLTSSGLIEGSELPLVGERQGRFRTSRLMPRVVVSRSLPKFLEPVAQLLRAAPLGLLSLLVALISISGFLTGGWALFSQGGTWVTLDLGPVFTATALQLLIIFFHESAHALVAQILRVPVRGLGFAMLFWFMPVAYVDRTDAYRLRGRRPRVAIALAGITSDGFFCGMVGIAAFYTSGFWQDTLLLLLTFQLIGLLINLNPLLPSDGYSALETATGAVDFRGRSFAYLKSAFSRKPVPGHLENLSWQKKSAHILYAAVSMAYVLLVAALLTQGVSTAVQDIIVRTS